MILTRTRIILRMALAAVTACAATLASAQGIASRLGPQPAEIEKEGFTRGDLARRTVYAFAACVVHRHRNQALQWLSLSPDDPTQTQKASSFADDTCLMNGEMQFSPNIFRGALYVALYRTQFGEKAPLPDAASIAVAAGNAGPIVHSSDMLTEFANCVVRRDPSNVRSLVLAVPGTPRENQALAVISPQFSLCLVQGSQFQLTKSVLAALLAEALYRQSTAPAAVTKAGASR